LAQSEHGLFNEPVTEPGGGQGQDHANQKVAGEIRDPRVNKGDVPEVEAVADPAQPHDRGPFEKAKGDRAAGFDENAQDQERAEVLDGWGCQDTDIAGREHPDRKGQESKATHGKKETRVWKAIEELAERRQSLELGEQGSCED